MHRESKRHADTKPKQQICNRLMLKKLQQTCTKKSLYKWHHSHSLSDYSRRDIKTREATCNIGDRWGNNIHCRGITCNRTKGKCQDQVSQEWQGPCTIRQSYACHILETRKVRWTTLFGFLVKNAAFFPWWWCKTLWVDGLWNRNQDVWAVAMTRHCYVLLDNQCTLALPHPPWETYKNSWGRRGVTFNDLAWYLWGQEIFLVSLQCHGNQGSFGVIVIMRVFWTVM